MIQRIKLAYQGWWPANYYISPCAGFSLAIAAALVCNHLRPGPAVTVSPLVLFGLWVPGVYATFSQILSGHEVEETPTGQDITDRQVRMYEIRLMAPGAVFMFGGLLAALLPLRWFLPGIGAVTIGYAALAAAHWKLAYRQYMQDVLRGRGKLSRYTTAVKNAARFEQLTACEHGATKTGSARLRTGWTTYVLLFPISALTLRPNGAILMAAPTFIQNAVFVVVFALPGSIALLAAAYRVRYIRFGIERSWNVFLAYQAFSVAAIYLLVELGVVVEKLGPTWLSLTLIATAVITTGVYRANTAATARADTSWWFPLSVGWHRNRQQSERAVTSTATF